MSLFSPRSALAGPVHFDDFGRGTDGYPVCRGGADGAQRFADVLVATDEDNARVRRLLEKPDRRKDGNGRAVIATHRVDGYADAHQFSGDAS
jgi:hypothetical protein